MVIISSRLDRFGPDGLYRDRNHYCYRRAKRVCDPKAVVEISGGVCNFGTQYNRLAILNGFKKSAIASDGYAMPRPSHDTITESVRKLYPTLQSYLFALAILSAATVLHLTLRATVGIGSTGATALYILALLMSAWRGFGPGYLTLFVGLTLVPYLYRTNHSLAKIDPYVAVLLIAVSSATSQLSRARHRLEDALRDANDRANSALLRRVAELETLYTQLPVGICFLDVDLRYVRVNDKLAAMHGRPAEAHNGRSYGEVVNPKLADILDPLLRGVLDTGAAVLNYEVTGPLSVSAEEECDYMITCSRVATTEAR